VELVLGQPGHALPDLGTDDAGRRGEARMPSVAWQRPTRASGFAP